MPELEQNPESAAIRGVLLDTELYRALLDRLEEGIYIVDRDRRILFWNHGAEQITGYHPHEVAGRLCQSDLLMHCDTEGETLCGSGCPLATVMLDGHPRDCIVFLRHKEGHRVPVRVRSRAIHGRDGSIAGAVELFEVAGGAERSHLQRLEAFGCVDELTRVATRGYGELKVAQALQELKAYGIPLGWLRIRLAGADDLIGRYGRGIIDAALKVVARTLDANIGSIDLLAYWGETEFRIAVYNYSRPELQELCRKLRTLVACSQVGWWGDMLTVAVDIDAVMAEPGDAIARLESRFAKEFPDRNAGD